ncbi:MAG: hypothetical protein ACE37F_12340 [Nannocystaceae bacterium]|nr:hypothetical protein [bacterium]
MRRLLLASSLLLACDSKTESLPDAPTGPDPVGLPTAADVCAAYKAVDLPQNVFVLSANLVEAGIKHTADKGAAVVEVTELRSESEPPEGERQMHRGFVQTRRLTLEPADTGWAVRNEEETSRDRIFYVRRPLGEDPRTFFGEQIVQRYGPKGGIDCMASAPGDR